MFVDIHTHSILNQEFPRILNLAFPNAEITFSSNKEGLFSVGIHPWDAVENAEKMLSDLGRWASDNRFVAFGECGLDKHSKVSLETQLRLFSQQIELSERFQKPLIIHCVGCFNELFELKTAEKPKQLWIIHGFRGKPELAKQALKNGCALSFGEYFNPESVLITPLNKLFVETDESKLPIEEIYNRIATVKNCSPISLFAGTDFYNQILIRNKLNESFPLNLPSVGFY